MHITAEDMVVEIVDDHGRQLPPGIPGEVVVTHLYSDGFPFIRYRTGDVAVLSTTNLAPAAVDCPCSRKFAGGRTTCFARAMAA